MRGCVALPEGKPIRRSKSAAGPRDGITALRLVQAAKRLADIAAAIAGIVLFSPLLLITSVAIKLDSRGPVLIRQTLYGQKSGPIKAFKFRFVTACAENDPASYRLTRVGRMLCQSGIDALPGLFNVLRGEMSIIGSPSLPSFQAAIEQSQTRSARQRMIGNAQIVGTGERRPEADPH
jgi:lipopolysaccharide/colanic/teichoic acid biosynthesis glycosyltransferase